MKISQSKQNENTLSLPRRTAAVVLGAASCGAYLQYAKKQNKNMMSDAYLEKAAKSAAKRLPDAGSFEENIKAGVKVLKETGLEAKGVEIRYFKEPMLDAMIEILKKEKPTAQNIASLLNFKALKYGTNASYGENQIFIPMKQLYSAVFHEAGHAHNEKMSKIMKLCQDYRRIHGKYKVITACMGIFAFSLFHNPRPDKDENGRRINKSFFEKTKDFTRKHIGLITFATALPILVEEGVASKKGIRFAKGHLSPQKIKVLKRSYLNALGTYVKTYSKPALVIGSANIIATAIQRGSLSSKKK